MKRAMSFFVFLFTVVLLQSNSYASLNKLKAYDTPNDSGSSITLEWEAINPEIGIREIKIFRSDSKEGKYEEVAKIDATESTFHDKGVVDNKEFFYKLVVMSKDGMFGYEIEEPVMSKAQWFNSTMLYFLLLCLIISIAIIFYIETSKRGKKHFIRKIAGLDAIEEAIGRATEMGRPLLYIPGINDMDNVQTLAGLNILGMVASKVAEYDTPLLMPTTRSLVMTTGREIVKEAYIAAGRPDAYDEKKIYYTTDDQFGYVAAINGVIVRDRPATCIYMGSFFAESLILAEVGNSVGAIQIAGTAQVSQLPFFIAACDYTLLGEELFAASAYLSQNPQEVGSLKGQDIGKLIAMISILVGTIFVTLASITSSTFIQKASSLIISFFTVNV